MTGRRVRVGRRPTSTNGSSSRRPARLSSLDKIDARTGAGAPPMRTGLTAARQGQPGTAVQRGGDDQLSAPPSPVRTTPDPLGQFIGWAVKGAAHPPNER